MNKWINKWINKFMNWLIIVNYQYAGKYCLTNKHLLYRYQARQTDKEADTGGGQDLRTPSEISRQKNLLFQVIWLFNGNIVFLE